MDLGNKIFELRKKAGLSQEELGHRLNVTRQSVSLWETNQAQPTLENLLALSNIFNVSIDELCETEQDNIQKEKFKMISDGKEEPQEALFGAKTNYDKDLYERFYKILSKKQIVAGVLGVIASLVALIIIIATKESLVNIIFPILSFCFCVSLFIHVKLKRKEQVQISLASKPNLQTEFFFYNDHFEFLSKSDNSASKHSKKYDEVVFKKQDEKYIYLGFKDVLTAIDKRTCGQNVAILDVFFKFRSQRDKTSAKTRRLLITFFISSLASIMVALFVCVAAFPSSPTPSFPLLMEEHMWRFFLLTPIPVTSAILGIIYLKKGYKCKKNIIAGVIMTALLCVYGSFTSIYKDKISHDYAYLDNISAIVQIDFPDEGYISIAKEYTENSESLAMAKFSEQGAAEFSNYLQTDNNWKTDITYIPSSIVDGFVSSKTSGYDYFTVYNVSKNVYNDFDGKIIFMAYDIELSTLFILCYK